MYCGEASLVNSDGQDRVAVSLKCRSWSCDLCAPQRAKALRLIAEQGCPDTFITLTVNPARFSGPIERARVLADAWRKTVKAACRKYGYKKIEYLAVFEKTKAGEPHLHIAARVKWLDQAWLSARMNEYIGAPIVDIRRIKSVKQAVAYISKYIGKAAQQFGTCKRYWTTQGYVANKEKHDKRIKIDGEQWGKVEACLRDIAINWVREFREVKWIRSDFIRAGPKYSAGWLNIER